MRQLVLSHHIVTSQRLFKVIHFRQRPAITLHTRFGFLFLPQFKLLLVHLLSTHQSVDGGILALAEQHQLEALVIHDLDDVCTVHGAQTLASLADHVNLTLWDLSSHRADGGAASGVLLLFLWLGNWLGITHCSAVWGRPPGVSIGVRSSRPCLESKYLTLAARLKSTRCSDASGEHTSHTASQHVLGWSKRETHWAVRWDSQVKALKMSKQHTASAAISQWGSNKGSTYLCWLSALFAFYTETLKWLMRLRRCPTAFNIKSF